MDTTKTDTPTDDATTPQDGAAAEQDKDPGAPLAEARAQDAGAPLDEAGAQDADEHDEHDEHHEGDEHDEPVEETPTGVGSAASATVAAGLGLVALSGTWFSRVLAERETLLGQIQSVTATSTQAKIEALYGNAWHMTALVNGLVSALALLLAVFVLLRPAFGAPGRVHPTWVKAVAWSGVALGVLGLLVFGLMYLDVLAPLPTAA
ncbi:hypothetical protein [Streptomyces sp. WAC06614]|uniref:hypothetical protein n=1 Tax=Streptomyces sp. WAC06614 TaxID=2487416 RepID=UPI000F78FE3B|nr:hypothetical protein [Streptomyces sp. WAC06614]RSS60980.1 hypothetical protein EF918_32245 [Streptomyces sp. WAC06614]